MSSKKQKIEVKEEVVALFPKEDKELMKKLFRVAAPSPIQVQQILEMYRKYVNPAQPFTNSSCGNCQSNLSKIYSNLREWYSNNINKFEE